MYQKSSIQDFCCKEFITTWLLKYNTVLRYIFFPGWHPYSPIKQYQDNEYDFFSIFQLSVLIHLEKSHVLSMMWKLNVVQYLERREALVAQMNSASNSRSNWLRYPKQLHYVKPDVQICQIRFTSMTASQNVSEKLSNKGKKRKSFLRLSALHNRLKQMCNLFKLLNTLICIPLITLRLL